MLLNPSSPVVTTVSFFRFVFEIVIIHNFRVVLDGSSGSPRVCHRTSLKEMFLNLILCSGACTVSVRKGYRFQCLCVMELKLPV